MYGNLGFFIAFVDKFQRLSVFVAVATLCLELRLMEPDTSFHVDKFCNWTFGICGTRKDVYTTSYWMAS